MLSADTLSSLIPQSMLSEWLAFLHKWNLNYGSAAMLPCDLVTEFRQAGLGGPMAVITRRAATSTINRLLWRCAGRMWGDYAIAWAGADDAGRYLYRLFRLPPDERTDEDDA